MTEKTRSKAIDPGREDLKSGIRYINNSPDPLKELVAKAAISDGRETEEDAVLNISLRPVKLAEFIGQKDIVDNLKVCITAAKQRKEPLEHVLLSGPPGLGKTCLSHILAHEMHSKITATSGPAIERAGDLIGILTNLEKGDVLFIDEIHRLSKVVEEFLYPAMENSEIDFIIDKGPYAKTIKFHLKPFTLVGATTRSGLLSSPLRSRFGIFYHLDFYEIADLARIVTRSAKLLNIAIDLPASWTPVASANSLTLERVDFNQDGKLNKTMLTFERVADMEIK